MSSPGGKGATAAEQADAEAEQIKNEKQSEPRNEMVQRTLVNMGQHYSSKAFTARPGKGLPMEPQSDSSDEELEEKEGETPEEAKRRKEKKKAQRNKGKHDKYSRATQNENATDVQTLYSKDPSKYI